MIEICIKYLDIKGIYITRIVTTLITRGSPNISKYHSIDTIHHSPRARH